LLEAASPEAELGADDPVDASGTDISPAGALLHAAIIATALTTTIVTFSVRQRLLFTSTSAYGGAFVRHESWLGVTRRPAVQR
jgi:hypothetical protein